MRLTRQLEGFNDSQQQAVLARGNLAVQANAGSGKTSVIVERIVQLLAKSWDERSPLAVTSIAAITFTRKAAAELRERLSKAFLEMTKASSSALERTFWADQIDELSQAMIGTIDSLCARILREFAFVDGSAERIEPDFETLEEYDEQVLKREAIDRVINRLSSLPGVEGDDEKKVQVEACQWWATTQGYGALIDYLTSLLNHGVAPDVIVAAHRDLRPPHQRVEAAWQALPAVKHLTQDRAALVSLLDRLVKISDASLAKKNGKNLADLHDRLCRAARELESGEREGEQRALFSLKEALLTKEGECRLLRGLADVEEDLEILRRVWAPLLSSFEFDYQAEVAALSAADKLVRLAEPVHAEYQRLCRTNGRYDFLTLERRTRSLLAASPKARAQLKSRYRYVLVDEFQDTNQLQWEIVSWLVGAGPDGQLDRDRLFIVGDPQQSIYRFRHADVAVFARATERIRASNQHHGSAGWAEKPDRVRKGPSFSEEQHFGLLRLAENYRSLSPVPLEVMDRVFRHVFDPAVHGLDIEHTPFEIEYQPLSSGMKSHQHGVGELRYVLPREDGEENSEENKGPDSCEESAETSDRLGRLQVRAVVDQLVSLHGQPKYTARNGELATLTWKDMAVLLPSRSVVLTELEKELHRREVPFVVTKGIGFWQRQEVRDVVNLTSCLADGGDELALFGLLRSPLGQLTDTQILFLSQLGQGQILRGLQMTAFLGRDLDDCFSSDKECRKYLAERLEKLPAAVKEALRQVWREFSTEATERLRRTANWLGNQPIGSWRLRVDRMAHTDLLQRALAESGAYAIYAAELDGDLILANLERLFALIRGEEQRSARGLAQLARWLRQQRDGSLKEEQATLALDRDAIQIMTVHAAKGLEFAVVAVMKMDRKVLRPSLKPLMVMPPGEALLRPDAEQLADAKPGMVTVRIRHPKYPRTLYKPRLLCALHRLERAQELAESRRLFYVSATRAKERLILAGKEPGHSGSLHECWQKWFEDALSLTEDHKKQQLWEDASRGHRVQIITGTMPDQPVGKEGPVPIDQELSLEFIHEGPLAPTIAATGLEKMKEQWRKQPKEWWLKYRVHVNPFVRFPGANQWGGDVPSEGPSLGSVVGLLVHRLFEMPEVVALQTEEQLGKLLQAMAINALSVPQQADDSSEDESLNSVDPARAEVIVDSVLHLWKSLHKGKEKGNEIRLLLDALGETEVHFAMKLGRWCVSGRFDKLLSTDGGYQIVDWKTDKDEDPRTIVQRHTPQMQLYALALHQSGRAALVDGAVQVHLALLSHLRVERLRFTPEELTIFATDLVRELQEMDAYHPRDEPDSRPS